jgi:SSS family solute:Na+ symporter
MILLVLVASYVFAITYEGSLVRMLLTAYGGIVQFAPALIAALCWRRATGAGILAGMLCGTVLTAVFILRPEWRTFAVHPGLYGLVLNAVVLIALSLAGGRGATAGDEFLRVARGGQDPA